MPEQACVFCSPPEAVLSNELALALPNKYPVNPGHMLIVPKRHVATLFDMTPAEREAVDDLLFRCHRWLRETLPPLPAGDTYDWTVGWNCGRWAGQTIFHAHLHLLPRFCGDTSDPRFGILRAVPERFAYPVGN